MGKSRFVKPGKNHPYPAISNALQALDDAIPNDVIAVVATQAPGKAKAADPMADAVLLLRTTSKKRVIIMVNAFLDAIVAVAEHRDDETITNTLKMMKLIWGAQFRSIGLKEFMALNGQGIDISFGLDPEEAEALGKLPKVRDRSREARNRNRDKKLYGHKT